MPGEGKRTGRQPASEMYSGRPGQAPAVLSFIYPICSAWRGEERRDGTGFLHQRAGPLGGRGNIIGLLSLAVLAPIRHVSLPRPPTRLADRLRSRALRPSGSEQGRPKQDLSLVLTVAFIWSGEAFLPPSPRLIPTILSPRLSLAQAPVLETCMQLGWLSLRYCHANECAVRDRPPVCLGRGRAGYKCSCRRSWL